MLTIDKFCSDVGLGIILFVFLGACASGQSRFSRSGDESDRGSGEKVPDRYESFESPLIGMSPSGDQIELGGYSGLMYLGTDKETGDLLFRSHSDRGPNSETVALPEGDEGRPFLIPQFQPRWVNLRALVSTGELKVESETLLQDPLGDALTGRPPLYSDDEEREDEIPIDLSGKELDFSLWGSDLESMTADAQGNIWMGDEYLPSLLKFDSEGRLIKRFYPKKVFHWRDVSRIKQKYSRFMSEALPEVYSYRQANRGFEGVAINGKYLVAIVQSPLAPAKAHNEKIVRILMFDTEKEKVFGEFLYELDSEAHRISDMTLFAPGEFLVIEQDGKTGKNAFKRVFHFTLGDATNLSNKNRFAWKPPETDSSEALSELQLKYVKKKELVNLVAEGYSQFEKVEGLTVIDKKRIAVINDNDFGVEEVDSKGNIKLDKNKKTVLQVIRLK